MSLIKSISGIRGTIGGKQGEGLSPLDVVRFASAYAQFIKSRNNEKVKVVVGRDARISGDMVNRLVNNALIGTGVDVVDLGMSTTPTVELAVKSMHAHGGVIITASHNPREWNALKLLNNDGEFLSADEGREVLEIAENSRMEFANVDNLGRYASYERFVQEHIEKILALPMVDQEAIKSAGLRVVIDCVNSTGGIALPALLKALGVEKIDKLYSDPTGEFLHNPEPVPENLTEISKRVVTKKADVGFAVDPDVDRLAIISENGEFFGEEYTLVAVADYILQNKKGNTVSNLSSSQALRDISEEAGVDYHSSAVGEVNVVEKMKEVNAIIGGEGNGGVIYPELHYGRDALVGIALFLSYLAKSDKLVSGLRARYPSYSIQKDKIKLTEDLDVDGILYKLEQKYQQQPISTVDGLKIEFDKEWVHMRKSNTEPIIRIYAESESAEKATDLAQRFAKEIEEIAQEIKS